MYLIHDLLKNDIEEFTTGEIIFECKDISDQLYIILEGEVHIMTSSNGIVLATLGQREIFGEMAMLLGEARSASAIAATKCKVLVISEKTAERLFKEEPKLALYIMKVLAKRLAKKNIQIKM